VSALATIQTRVGHCQGLATAPTSAFSSVQREVVGLRSRILPLTDESERHDRQPAFVRGAPIKTDFGPMSPLGQAANRRGASPASYSRRLGVSAGSADLECEAGKYTTAARRISDRKLSARTSNASSIESDVTAIRSWAQEDGRWNLGQFSRSHQR
jgi:hypothetical protein